MSDDNEQKLAIWVNPVFYHHETGSWHPEAAFRIDAALDGVRRAGAAARLVNDAPEHPATDRIIARVHSAAYSRALRDACQLGAPRFHSPDNPISAATWDAARLAVSTALSATDALDANRPGRSFVIARPPGHHAEKERAMGFCFFNNIACAAEYLLERPAIDRVFILDWDVHHGNGTQHMFEDRADVFYLSLHQYPFFPGTGSANEIGRGEGEGFTRNVPMDAGSGDGAYLRAFDEIVLPAIDAFRPDAILVSAGFDAHERDPIGEMGLTSEVFGRMTRAVVEAAGRHCGGRVFSILEGGYDREGLASCVARHIEELA